MTRTRSALAALLLAVVVPAQAGDAKKPAPLVEFDKLVAEWTAATKGFQEATKALVASEAWKAAAAAKARRR